MYFVYLDMKKQFEMIISNEPSFVLIYELIMFHVFMIWSLNNIILYTGTLINNMYVFNDMNSFFL